MDGDNTTTGVHGNRKRKWSPADHTSQAGLLSPSSALESGQTREPPTRESSTEVEGTNKRARQLSPSSGFEPPAVDITTKFQKQWTVTSLPPELLQHVFSILDPVSLGRLLSVCKTFNALLDPHKPSPQGSGLRGKYFSVQTQDSVWSISRKTHHPGFPRPLEGLSESDMWRLIRGRGCQFCGKQSASRIPLGQPSPWSAGPGPDNVRIIWPFHVRSCGKCLESRLVKEPELLFSTFSSLMPALAFAFLTPSLHYVTSIVLRHSSAPPGLHLTKYFFRPQVEDIKSKLEEVRSFGLAAAEEWFKGLENGGREKANDAARLEQWEATGGSRAFSTASSTTTTPAIGTPDPALTRRATPFPSQQPQQAHYGIEVTRPPVVSHPPPPMMIATIPPAPGTLPNFPLKPMTPAPGQYTSNTQRQPTTAFPTQHVSHPKADRSIRDVNQMKADRRAEIERRCLQLDPPILPSTLVYMDAFAAAMQIPMALNDNAWQLLKTRLLNQRRDAEVKEEEQRIENLHLQAKNEERRQQEEQLRIARENLDRHDRDSDETQDPMRKGLALYADEHIDSRWGGGKLVTIESAAQFAADVLMHVRGRFFEDLGHQNTIFGTAGTPRTDVPAYSRQSLKLEHMKWVYETKVKPITEHYRRELFLCSGCEHSYKYYALDAVIQHYAAKHTSTLSHGTAVVYWKSEWPEEPPFDPRPSMKFSQNRHSDFLANETSPLYSEHGFASNAPFDRRYPRGDQPLPTGSGRTWPQPPFSPMISGPRVFQPNPSESFLPPRPPSQATNGDSGVQHFAGDYPTPLPSSYHKPGRFPQPALTSPQFPVPAAVMRGGPAWHQQPLPSPTSIVPQDRSPAGLPGQPGGIYHVQIDDLACYTRDMWDATDGIENLPSSVRVQVIILHVILRFSKKYTNEPYLTLFTDALNNDSRMSSLRGVGGLTCKVCSRNSSDFARSQSEPTTHIGTVYMLPELARHFQVDHIETDRSRARGGMGPSGVEIPRLDWKFDMIELPDTAIIASLVRAPGMTDSKLSTIASVLPKYFPLPLPKLDSNLQVEESAAGATRTLADSAMAPLNQPALVGLPSTQQIHRAGFPGYSQDGAETVYSPSFEHRPALVPVAEDEYDPHRPAPAYSPPRRSEVNRNFVPPRHEPAYARRIFLDAHGEPYAENDPYGAPNRQPQFIYRYRDYSAYEVPARYEQEYYVRERFDRPPPRPVSRDQVYRPDEIPDRRETYTPQRSLRFIEDRDIPSPARGLVKQEALPVANIESMDATEDFLNNFESIAANSYPDNDARTLSNNFVTDNSSDRRTAPNLAGNPDTGHAFDTDRPGTRIESSGGTPGRGMARSRDERGRSRSPWRPEQNTSFAEEDADAEASVRHSRTAMRSRERDSDEGPPTHGSTRVIEYDQRGLPLNTPQLTARQPADTSYYRDRSPPRTYQQRRLVAPDSPEFYRPRPVEGQIRFAEVRPAAQHRYVEDEAYYDDGRFPPVGYVRVIPRETQPPGRYYIERPREYLPEYVERNGRSLRDQVYERDGHLYTRASPPERRYEPYDAPARY